MTSSRDTFLEQREFESHHEMLEESHSPVLPSFDMNEIKPSSEIIKLELSDKPETFNRNSYDLAMQIIEAVKEGKINPLELAVKKKLVTDALDIAMKDKEVKKIMVDEVEKYGKEGTISLGAKVYLTNTTKYDYSVDPTWKSLSDSIAPIQEQIKEQEKKIKAACQNGGSIIDEDGVMVASIVPSPTTKSIAVSFSKKK